jgi:hypothetical protein
MNKDSRGGDDLSALIRQAEGEVSKQVRRAPAAPGGSFARPALGTALAALAIYGVYSLWALFAPPSADKVTHDLEVAIEAARESVEKAKSESGQLPEAIPSASLGSVVRYEHGPSDYRLSATILGIRVTLERDGKKIVEKGVQQ